ncbi:MAG: nucleoside kinase [Lachnospiraceae bacterium]|nr:nucleoside kinase [Lachnospiraceae bacterium]
MREITFEVDGELKTYPEGTRLSDVAADVQEFYRDDIILAKRNGKLCELHHKVKPGDKVIFVTTADGDGRRTYRRSATMLMQKAVFNVFGGRRAQVYVLNALDQGYYCELGDGRHFSKDRTVDEEFIRRTLEEMKRLQELNLPIEKKVLHTDAAVELFSKLHMTEKEKLFRYRRSSRVNIYMLEGYIDYFYGYMVPSTGYIKYYDIKPYGDGFVLLFPDKDTKKVADFRPSSKHFEAMMESTKWSRTMEVSTVGEMNDVIAHGRVQDIILMQEALMERRIGALAEQIVASGDKKFVMIAGPSSSGKTTFSHRLSTQLSALGMKPHPVALDNYYLDRDKTPLDEDGNMDFECLEALDIELFNRDMTRLLNGEEVDMPTFNFKTGKREYKGDRLKLGKDDILVLEGIHGLNDKLSYSLPAESKYKIFISALTTLNIDEHNYISTSDGRLLRRIVRDARSRNTTAEETIAMWYSVRRGEEKYIYPFQQHADVMFNSALIYELGVLKVYAEPLLFNIRPGSPQYQEAKRLLKFLDYFLPVPTDIISNNSIIREFIGGSIFPV